jgi:hypothetical protein
MAGGQPVPAGWKVLKDEKGVCQVAVPANWRVAPAGMNASLGSLMENMATVTSDVDRLQPMPETAQKILGVTKMIENTDQRVFYFSRTEYRGNVALGYHTSVPGKGGKGRCHVAVGFKAGMVTDDVAKQIALTLAPVQ